MKRIFTLSLLSLVALTAFAQNKDTLLVNLTNFKLYAGTYSWREALGVKTNTYYDMTSWESSPYTEGHLKQGAQFRLNYRLLYPNAKTDKSGWNPNYKPGYPLILILHGGGERGNCWDANCWCASCSVNGSAPAEWIYVNLGASYSINRIKINWKDNISFGFNFLVQVSSDAITWTTLQTVASNTNTINDYTGLLATAQYVRVYGTKSGNSGGYAVSELEVYNTTNTNVALSKVVTVSTTLAPSTTNAGAKAVDGNIITQWASTYAALEYLNNDHVLANGGQAHLNAVNLAGTKLPNDPSLNGRAFPGFVLFPQNVNTWGSASAGNSDLSYAIRIIRLLTKQLNIDPNRIYIHGLSLGGQAVYKALNMADWLFAAAAPMSALNSVDGTEYDSVTNIPLWTFQGGQDINPLPSVTNALVRNWRLAGGIARYSLYPNLGHGTWNTAYAEPDFFIWLLSQNKANIHVPFGNPNICGTTGAGVKLTLAQGFYAYQWERDGQLIAGATGYTYMATIPGVYRARFSRISASPTELQWNRWSDPVTISEQSPVQPQLQQVNSIVLNDLNNIKNATLKGSVGMERYYWYKNGVLTTLPNVNTVTINGCSVAPTYPCPQSGTYTLITEGIDKCPSLSSAAKYVVLGMTNGTTVVPTPIITQPINFTGNVTSPSSILLAWGDASKNERGYEIWRRKSTDLNNQWKMPVLTAEDVTLFHDTGLEPSTTYFYKIRAVNNTGRSNYAPSNSTATNLVIRTSADNAKPTPPQNLTATVIGINKITLTWGASTDDSGIKDYYVYYGSDSVLIGSANTTYTLNNSRLILNTTYNFTVRAVDLAGNLSSKSNQVTASTYVDGLFYEHTTGAWTDLSQIAWVPPAVPEFTGRVPNFTLAPRTQDDFFNFKFYGYIYIDVGSTPNSTSTNLTYSWQVYSNDGAELFIDGVSMVKRAKTAADGACSSTTKNLVQLSAGYHTIEVRYFDYTGSHCLDVRYRGPDTYDSKGVAKFISIPDIKLRSYKILTPPIAPIAPTDLAAISPSMTQIDLSWHFDGTLPVNYELYRSTALSGSFTMINRVSTLAYSDINLTPGTTYYYKIRTVNTNGTSAFTSVVNATTQTDTEAPTQPTALASSGSSFTSASLIWNASTDNILVTGYEIWANGILIGTSSIRGHSATNLTPLTSYSFTIIAYDASGNKSIASTPLVIITSTPDTYYSKETGNLNVTTTWGKNPDGTGANPSFNSNGQYLIVSNRTTSSLGGKWTVEGTFSKIIVPSGVTLTVDNALAGRVEVQGNGKLELNNPNVPNIISLSPTSTVNYNTASFIQSNTYGNLGLGGTGNKTFPVGTVTVAGNLTCLNGVVIKGAINNGTKILLGGDLKINGALGFTAPDLGVQLELTNNGTQTFTSGGDLYFRNINTAIGNTNLTIINSGTPVSLNLGSFNGGGLTLGNGSQINLGNNNLVVTRSGVVNPNNESGKLSINGGNINITSNSNQNSNLHFDAVNNQVNKLGIDLTGTGDVLIQEDILISDAIKIKNGELNSSGHITLVSNVTKTANINEIEGNGIITGDVSVQRFIDPKEKVYRYIATSVKGTTIEDWQKAFPITGGFTGGSTGFTNNPSMFMYNNGAWTGYPTAAGSNQDTVARGTGYAAFLRNGALPITLLQKGNPYQGNISFDLDPDPSAASTDGWNLLGNPYASTIAWGTTGWTISGLSSTVSVRDNPEGVFRYYDYVTGMGDLLGGKIAPGQAFWVQAISATPSLIITEKAKSNQQQTLFRSRSSEISHLTLSLKQGTKVDRTFIAFTEMGTDEFDSELDAVKQQNVGMFNLSTLSSNNVSIAINNMSNSYCNKTVKVNIQNVSVGTYNMIFDDIQSMQDVGTITLHDDFTNTDLLLTDGAQYSFAVTANTASYGETRLSLKFLRPEVNNNLSMSSTTICGNNDAVIKISNSQTGVEYHALNDAHEIISETIIGNGEEISIMVFPSALTNGNNNIKVSAGFTGCSSELLSSTAKVMYTPTPNAATQETVSVCQGGSAFLTASGAPESGSYKWFDENLNEITAEKSSTYKTTTLFQNTQFYVSAISENGCAGLNKMVDINVENIETPDVIFENDTLFSTANGLLQWYKDGEPILGANSNFYLPEYSGAYSVENIQNSCSRVSEPYGVKAIDAELGSLPFSLSVYPNPTHPGNLNVKIVSSNQSDLTISVVDVVGKNHYLNTFNHIEAGEGIKLSPSKSLANGVYFIIVSQSNGVVKRKIIINE